MLQYKQEFMDYMDANEIKYVDKEENRVLVSYKGSNLESIPIYVFFNKEDEPLVQLACWNIANFKAEKKFEAIKLCNDMNAKWRWVKFYIDDDNDVRAELDATLVRGSAGDVAMQMVRRMVNIVDEAYPDFMRVKLDL